MVACRLPQWLLLLVTAALLPPGHHARRYRKGVGMHPECDAFCIKWGMENDVLDDGLDYKIQCIELLRTENGDESHNGTDCWKPGSPMICPPVCDGQCGNRMGALWCPPLNMDRRESRRFPARRNTPISPANFTKGCLQYCLDPELIPLGTGFDTGGYQVDCGKMSWDPFCGYRCPECPTRAPECKEEGSWKLLNCPPLDPATLPKPCWDYCTAEAWKMGETPESGLTKPFTASCGDYEPVPGKPKQCGESCPGECSGYCTRGELSCPPVVPRNPTDDVEQSSVKPVPSIKTTPITTTTTEKVAKRQTDDEEETTEPPPQPKIEPETTTTRKPTPPPHKTSRTTSTHPDVIGISTSSPSHINSNAQGRQQTIIGGDEGEGQGGHVSTTVSPTDKEETLEDKTGMSNLGLIIILIFLSLGLTLTAGVFLYICWWKKRAIGSGTRREPDGGPDCVSGSEPPSVSTMQFISSSVLPIEESYDQVEQDYKPILSQQASQEMQMSASRQGIPEYSQSGQGLPQGVYPGYTQRVYEPLEQDNNFSLLNVLSDLVGAT